MSDTVTWPTPQRAEAFARWVAAVGPRHGLQPETLRAASADASFRRYLRVTTRHGGSLIVMDAPPPREDVRPFVHVARLALAGGLHVPRVIEADEAAGFLLLSDFGDELYLDALRDPARADSLMRDALSALVRWQTAIPAGALPRYDEALLRDELTLFTEWCVQRKFGIRWSPAQCRAWDRASDRLVQSALAQPVVAVHRDWMPRNLMVCAPNPGILDFQDAASGPLTYDLACLLRDAFISWDEEQEIDWAVRWWQMAREQGVPLSNGMRGDFGEFWRALEWMGLHRHLRVIGIFCRLEQRDGKARYVADLPRFFGYATKVAMRYAPLSPLLPLLEPMSKATVATGYTF